MKTSTHYASCTGLVPPLPSKGQHLQLLLLSTTLTHIKMGHGVIFWLETSEEAEQEGQFLQLLELPQLETQSEHQQRR